MLILDTETTGLGATDQVIQVAICDMSGNELFDRLVTPTVPISGGALAVHGIHEGKLVDAPPFIDIARELLDILTTAEGVIIYNAEYDTRILSQTLLAYGQPPWAWLTNMTQCAMQKYAAFVGDWSNRHEAYKFQKLKGGDHTALGDCRATLDVIVEMAEAA